VSEDRRQFAGKPHLVSLLSWLDFCDQLITNANPIVSRALAADIRRRLLDDCIEPAVLQTYAAAADTCVFSLLFALCTLSVDSCSALTLWLG